MMAKSDEETSLHNPHRANPSSHDHFVTRGGRGRGATLGCGLGHSPCLRASRRMHTWASISASMRCRRFFVRFIWRWWLRYARSSTSISVRFTKNVERSLCHGAPALLCIWSMAGCQERPHSWHAIRASTPPYPGISFQTAAPGRLYAGQKNIQKGRAIIRRDRPASDGGLPLREHRLTVI